MPSPLPLQYDPVSMTTRVCSLAYITPADVSFYRHVGVRILSTNQGLVIFEPAIVTHEPPSPRCVA